MFICFGDFHPDMLYVYIYIYISITQKQELVDVFAKQLDATLNTTLCKYLNKK